MATVDPLFAQWLQDEGLWSLSENATLVARWGDDAVKAERMTSIALKSDAEAEGARQLTFMGGPIVLEEHQLRGEWRAFRGRVITLTVDKLGYGAGLAVFVLGAADNRATGISTVTVLRRL